MMRSVVSLTLIAFLFSAVAHGQSEQISSSSSRLPDLIPYRQGNLWGYANSTKQIIVPCIYEKALPLANGFAEAYRDSSLCIINGNGREVLKIKNARVWLPERISVCINCEDHVSYSPGYIYIVKYTSDKQQQSAIYDLNGNEIIPFKYASLGNKFDRFIPVSLNNKWSFINRNGIEQIPFIYDEISEFRYGMARVMKRDTIITYTKHKVRKEPKGILRYFWKGKVMKEITFRHEEIIYRYGFIDTTGKEVIPLIYQDAGGFVDGMAAVMKDSLCGFINTKGEVVIPLMYQFDIDTPEGISFTPFGSWFYSGLLKVKRGDQYGYINRKGEVIIPFRYDGATEFSSGIAGVMKNGKWAFINPKGKLLSGYEYDDIIFPHDGSGYAHAHKKYIWCLVDSTGKQATPLKYCQLGFFTEGYCWAHYRTMINDNGETKCDPACESILLDSSGKEVPELSCIFGMPPITGFKEGLAFVQKNNLYGAINTKGEVIIPFKYQSAGQLENGIAEVSLNGISFYVDRYGNEYFEE